MSTKENHDRLNAIQKGSKVYQGKPCRKCGSTERYVNGSACRTCVIVGTRLRNPEIGKKYQQSDKGKARTKLRKQGVFANSVFDVVAYKQKERSKYLNSKDNWTSRQLQKYGLTLNQFDEMYESQEGKCSLCFTHQDELKIRMSVDHCHATGKVRSLLCNKCNTALGLINEDVDILDRMKEYVIKHKEKDNF